MRSGTDIISKCVDMGPDAVAGSRGQHASHVETESDEMTDAERVQALVNQMPPQYQTVFEAYHLGIIRGESCRGKPHKVRAILLGIAEKTYYRRLKWGRNYIRDWLLTALDW